MCYNFRMILHYDTTFEGFLSLVYDVYYQKLKPTNILKTLPNTLFNEEIITIETDETKSTKVLQALKAKFDKESFERVLNIFMCDSRDFEMSLLEYIIIGFRNPNELKNINHKAVFEIQNLERELFRVVHRMYGFVRFEELDDGTLYAKIEAQFNILYFLGKHFFQRLNNQKFIIHDIDRKLAFIKSDDFIGIRDIASFEAPQLSENEAKFRELWQHFFESVAITERKNLKLQQQFVPLIYRTYMSEFNS